MNHYEYRLTIKGPPVSYKRQRLGRRRALPDDVRQWRDMAIMQLRLQWGGREILTEPVAVTVAVYLGHGQRMDAINAAQGALDVMQEKCGRTLGAGIVKNDKQAKDVRILEFRDKNDPRIEITLRSFDGCVTV